MGTIKLKKGSFRLPYFLFLFFVFLATGCISDDEPQGEALGVGDYLPEFSVVMNDGTSIYTASLIGKVSMIVFFNTGCPDCRKELPEVQLVWEYYKEDPGVVILPIAREESESEILDYWESHDLNMPFSPQENRDVYSLFAPSIIPRIYISDLSGKIVFSSTDVNMPTAETLISEIESARQ